MAVVYQGHPNIGVDDVSPPIVIRKTTAVVGFRPFEPGAPSETRNDYVSLPLFPTVATRREKGAIKILNDLIPLPLLGRVYGNVYDSAAAATSRKVLLYDQRSGNCIDEAWAGVDGSYEFTGLRTNRQYMVVAVDYTGEYRAVIADQVYPEPV